MDGEPVTMTSAECPATNGVISNDATLSDDSVNETTLLPVAAVYNNLDLYIQSLNSRCVGNILQDICQLSDGGFIVISSNIDSKYNCGFVNRFKSLENIPSGVELYLNPGFGPCSTLENTKRSLVICGFDSGNLMALSDDALEVIENHRFFHNIVTSLRVNSSDSQLVAADFDGRLIVVDIETFDPLSIFEYAHNGSVNDLQFHPNNDSLVLSCGSDNDILLWDIRTNNKTKNAAPATPQLSCTTQVTSLHWSSENEIIFGTESGNVVRFDLRAQKVISTTALFPEKRIHKIRGLKSNQALAFLADDCNQMVIYDKEMRNCVHREQYCNNVELRSVIEIKQDDSHKLVTIGSGQSIFQHDDILTKL